MNSMQSYLAAPNEVVKAAEHRFAIENDQKLLQKAGNRAAQVAVFPALAVSYAAYALVTGVLAAIASPLGMVSSTVRESVVNPLFKQAEAATTAAMRSLKNTFVRVEKEEPKGKIDQLKEKGKEALEGLKNRAQALKVSVQENGKKAIAFVSDNKGKVAGGAAALALTAAAAYWQRENIGEAFTWAYEGGYDLGARGISLANDYAWQPISTFVADHGGSRVYSLGAQGIEMAKNATSTVKEYTWTPAINGLSSAGSTVKAYTWTPVANNVLHMYHGCANEQGPNISDTCDNLNQYFA